MVNFMFCIFCYSFCLFVCFNCAGQGELASISVKIGRIEGHVIGRRGHLVNWCGGLETWIQGPTPLCNFEQVIKPP